MHCFKAENCFFFLTVLEVRDFLWTEPKYNFHHDIYKYHETVNLKAPDGDTVSVFGCQKEGNA